MGYFHLFSIGSCIKLLEGVETLLLERVFVQPQAQDWKCLVPIHFEYS